MIYYKAICRIHGWESGLYLTRGAAARSARSHRENAQGPHDMIILEVYIPNDTLDIRSEEAI